MVKRLLFAVCALATLTLSAQRVGGGRGNYDSPEHKVTFGPRIGLNICKYTPFADYTIGVNAGVNVDIPIYQNIYAQTGLFYTLKGAKAWDSGSQHIHYIQLPVMGSYHYDINESIQLQGSFGPYFAVKVGCSGGDEYYGDDIESFDMGLQFGAGVTIKKIYLGLGYELGLPNIRKEDSGVHNRNFNINVGYNF